MIDKLIVRGAKQHNLHNINVDIPKNKIVVFTGLSGSGKSTLAFDTIYAEGQRRYVESLSAYARQFLELMEKPEVDSIEGLSPAISIQQKTTNKNPRSTVGTVTEIYDYLRLLFAKIGQPHCPNCNKKIESQTLESITESVLRFSNQKSRLIILAPLIQGKKGTFDRLFQELYEKGFSRLRIDGQFVNLEELLNTSNDVQSNDTNNLRPSEYKDLNLNKQRKHNIDVIIDRLKPSLNEKSRIFESVQNAANLTNGIILTLIDDKEFFFSRHNACPFCKISIGNIEPRSFSFNSPFGACEECNGLGIKIEFDPDLIIPDKNKSIIEGAIKPWQGSFATFRSSMLKYVGKKFGFNLNTPIEKMSSEQINVILYGTNQNIYYKYESKFSQSKWEYESNFEGVIPNLQRLYNSTDSENKREMLARFMKEHVCDKCSGKRLKNDSLSIKLSEKSIMDVGDLPIDECYNFFNSLKLDDTKKYIAKNVLKEIRSRLEFLINVGLNYLTLNRSTSSLSGGESQRIRLATQIGSNLTGVLYVLDEPTIGLHQRDNDRLIKTLKRLRDLGNSLIIVEHDEDVIRNSDWIIDIGPGAGIHGGRIVAQGNLNEIIQNQNSLTGKYLKGEKTATLSSKKNQSTHLITIHGAKENNLKSIDVDIPIGCMTIVTGVSGSGKSTLINEILFKSIASYFGTNDIPGKHDSISGMDNIDKVIEIDQSPIGRTPRSNAATYVNAFTPIREIFSKTITAKEMGYNPGRFSFNVKSGRCESCEGCGVKRIEMQFLPDVYVKCNECMGKRYNSETLLVKYKGKTIDDILNFTVEEAMYFFQNIPIIYKKLKTLFDVGLGYIKLGQPATTFSGGEAQRIKLASELSKRDTGRTLYILDEPTTGLHFEDVKKLLKILNRLTKLGNTVVVIEHNLDVIASADWVIDLGPEGGIDGGQLVIEGPPEKIINYDDISHTAKFLKNKILNSKLIEVNS
ncbi:MAG TPA: excinuclease ABC subunit UvrA [Nitrososphaeraceae archaeon]